MRFGTTQPHHALHANLGRLVVLNPLNPERLFITNHVENWR